MPCHAPSPVRGGAPPLDSTGATSATVPSTHGGVAIGGYANSERGVSDAYYWGVRGDRPVQAGEEIRRTAVRIGKSP